LRIDFNFAGNLSLLGTAVKEWIGLIAYRVTGRTDQFLPGDGNQCGITENESA
jgi:hypothetical protein